MPPDDKDTAARYIRENFEPADRLAVVLLNKRTQDVIQRLAAAERIASSDFQAWLRYQNAKNYDVYVSINALASGAQAGPKQTSKRSVTFTWTSTMTEQPPSSG